MSCENWNDEWVGALYDELDERERERMSRHLENCESCRATLHELDDTRQLLHASAPAVPATARVVVLQPRAWRKPLWSFAAGVAAALVLFVGGVFTGTRLLGGNDELASLSSGQLLTRAEMDTALHEQQQHFEARLAAFDRRLQAKPAGQTADTLLTRREWSSEVQQIRRDLDVDQARVVEFLLQEINATEARAGTWIGETRDALRVVAMQGDPRFSEQ